MSLYKRKDSSVWWVKLHHSGKIVQRSTGTTEKVKAQEYHDRLKASLWEQERLGVKPSFSWQQAVVRWLQETTHKASRKDDLDHLRQLDKYLNGLDLVDISRDKVETIVSARLKDGVSNGRANRMLSVLRTNYPSKSCFRLGMDRSLSKSEDTARTEKAGALVDTCRS